MYQLIDSEAEPVSRLVPTVVSDRTMRSIEFKLPSGATPIPFDRDGRANYSPIGGVLTKEIRKDGADALSVEFIAQLKSTAVKAVWISRNHPERAKHNLIDSLPDDLRRAIEELAYGRSGSKSTAILPRAVAQNIDRSLPRNRIEVSSENFIYSAESFSSEDGVHRGYLYLRQFVIGSKHLKNLYLVKIKDYGADSYVLYDSSGNEIGPILESVDSLGDDCVVGKPGIIAQLSGLGLLDKTGYKSALGSVGRSRGELRKLTGVGTAANQWSNF